jgi:hypothetical protein
VKTPQKTNGQAPALLYKVELAPRIAVGCDDGAIFLAMHFNRRNFLRNSSVLVAGSAFWSSWPAAVRGAGTASTRSVTVPLTADDNTVLSWVAGYAGSYRLQGGSVLGKLKNSANKFTQIAAYMSAPPKFAGMLGQKSPIMDGVVTGDTYGFVSGATAYTLQNSGTALPTVTNADWKHQAIQYDPATGTLEDPLGATGTGAQIDYTLKLVTKTRTPVQNFSALVSGLVDSGLHGLTQDSAFNTFRNGVLFRIVTTAADAAAVNRILIQNLAILAQIYPANSFGNSILKTPLFYSSFPLQFKLSAAQVIAKFSALRPKINPAYSDEALWLAILLPAQTSPQKGDLMSALTPPANTGYNALISLDAIAGMSRLLKDPAFAAVS